MTEEPKIKAVDTTKKHPLIDTSETAAFMYKVTMLVQVVAPNRELANAKLDQDGGYVSRRDVEFVRSIVLFSEKEIEDSEKTEDN